MYIGEGATMASEAAMLGTPAIYYNSLEVSTIKKTIGPFVDLGLQNKSRI
jgi:predicted glycosyltransferase